ncbi:MAG: diadenylate cyclase CdaA [Clostridia bacterium]|nr:diadenylate cyclase CdaA [Clostridia bacterium]MBR2735598.1 diadenylate cyclase CdaA [Clostridia bacterium]
MEFLSASWRSFLSLIRTFNVYDFFDIVIVALLIYGLIKLVRESRAGQLVKGIAIILVAYFIACQLHFRMLSSLLNNFFQVSVFGLLIVFQPELRQALEKLGRSNLGEYWSANYIKKDKNAYDVLYSEIIEVAKEAVLSLSEEKMGALMVFERKTKLGDIISTGTIIKSKPSVPLICNIFYNKAPLHDGALIIRDGVLYAGGCILPLTKNSRLNVNLGTRHRAALGMSENSDAVVVVVSEETGAISIAVNGILTTYDDLEVFKNDLKYNLLGIKK